MSKPSVIKAVIAIAIVAFSVLVGYLLPRRAPAANPISADAKDPLQLVVAKSNAVVTIYGFDSRGRAISQGSGFFIDARGIGLTNAHVLNDSASAKVETGDGRVFQLLRIHGWDADSDLAVFQVGRVLSSKEEWYADLPFLELSNDAPQVGDKIITVGSPEGLKNTVSEGIVSAVRLVDKARFYQMTAPVSPGSSGGPVFGRDGTVLGVTTSQLRSGQNLNFAIPIASFKPLLQRRDNLSLAEVTVWNQTPLAARAEEQKLVGHSYVGTIHNEKYDLTATTAFFVVRDGDNISGCFLVFSPLFGSARIEGSANGSYLTIATKESDLPITFAGTLSDETFAGNFRVYDGPAIQDGTFRASKYKDLHRSISKCPDDDELNKSNNSQDQ
jgi:hypothetical protein